MTQFNGGHESIRWTDVARKRIASKRFGQPCLRVNGPLPRSDFCLKILSPITLFVAAPVFYRDLSPVSVESNHACVAGIGLGILGNIDDEPIHGSRIHQDSHLTDGSVEDACDLVNDDHRLEIFDP